VLETVDCTSRTSHVLQAQPIKKSLPARSIAQHEHTPPLPNHPEEEKVFSSLLPKPIHPLHTAQFDKSSSPSSDALNQPTNQPQPAIASKSKRETPNYFLPAWSTSASKTDQRTRTHTETSNNKTEVATTEKRLKTCSTQSNFSSQLANTKA